jgi:hypothetical protein
MDQMLKTMPMTDLFGNNPLPAQGSTKFNVLKVGTKQAKRTKTIFKTPISSH